MTDYDMTVNQGATFQRLITWYESDGVTPNDLTGYTAKMYLKRKVTDDAALVTLTTENAKLTLGGAAGTVTLEIPATETATMSGVYVYDLKLINGSYVKRLIEGKITVDSEVTKIA